MATNAVPRWFEDLLVDADELKHRRMPVFSGLKADNLLRLFKISTTAGLSAKSVRVCRNAIDDNLHNAPNATTLNKMYKTLAVIATEKHKKIACVAGGWEVLEGASRSTLLPRPATILPRSPPANQAPKTFAPRERAKRRTRPKATASVDRTKRWKISQARWGKALLRLPCQHLPLGGSESLQQQPPKKRPRSNPHHESKERIERRTPVASLPMRKRLHQPRASSSRKRPKLPRGRFDQSNGRGTFPRLPSHLKRQPHLRFSGCVVSVVNTFQGNSTWARLSR
jgi:hypothetical protein